MYPGNHTLIKKLNRTKILNAIRLHSPVSRSKLAEIVCLDRKSITNFVSEFLEEGIVEEIGKKENPRGRPFTLLQFKKNRNMAVGITIAPDRVEGVLIDLYGNVYSSHEIHFPLYTEIDKILNSVKKIYANFISQNGSRVYGIGIAIPGILNMQRGIVESSVNIPAIEGLEFKRLFSSFINHKLFFEDSSRAKALAEKWFGSGKDKNDFVCIDVGIGIGFGLINNRQLYRGAGYYAGEIGHVVIEKDGKKCRCGNRGCLEAYISENVIVEKINSLTNSSIRNLEEIENIPLGAEKIIQEAGYNLGIGLSYLVNIINPTTIIINGNIMKFQETVIPYILEGLRKHALKQCFENTSVLASNLKNSSALGAASLVLSDIFETEGYFYV